MMQTPEATSRFRVDSLTLPVMTRAVKDSRTTLDECDSAGLLPRVNQLNSTKHFYFSSA